MVAGGLRLRLFLKNVRRPGIAAVMPTLRGPCVLLDVGANISPKPEHLFQYGVMGSIFAKHILRRPQPTVGLLNVGSEEQKGHEDVREANRMLRELDLDDLDYQGFVEGNDISKGTVDVVVTDGFTGNILLKGLETAYALIGPPGPDVPPRAAALLGVAGTVVVCHGSATGTDLAAGIALAADLHRRSAVTAIGTLLTREVTP